MIFTDGEDYASIEKNLTFGLGFGTLQCIGIPIFNDVRLENELEFFNVSIYSNMDGVLIDEEFSEVQVFIEDNDCKYHQFG